VQFYLVEIRMSENQYSFKYDEFGNTREILVYGSGTSVNACSFINKGTAFNKSERERLGLKAILPPGVRPLEDQIDNSAKTVSAKVDDIEKYIFIRGIFDRNVTLAHALIHSDFRKYINIIYTPTIAEVVKRYSSMFRQANGLHFYPGNIDSAEDILRRYLQRDIRVAVVTDNQGIHGIGDQGIGGITISLGKLMLYTQAAGVAPWHCLPISLDVGTDNEELLNDERYLGWRHQRLKGEEYLAFMGRFVRAFRNVFPNALCQWEDFSKQNAFSIKDAFEEEIISFNDDIQGTGSVVLAALINAMKLKGQSLKEQKILINGADTAGVGVAQQLEQWLIEEGASAEEAIDCIYLIGSEGLVMSARNVASYKKKYGKNKKKLPWFNNKSSIQDIIEQAGITVLIDTTDEMTGIEKSCVELLSANTERPVIISLSTSNNDDLVKNLQQWSKDTALIATSLPFEKDLETDTQIIRQCHSIFVFPGIGLGVLASGARQVLPEFFTVAAQTVARCVESKDLQKGALLPSIDKISDITVKVAQSVAMTAVEKDLSRPCVYASFQHLNDEVRMKELISKMRWKPDYLPLVAM